MKDEIPVMAVGSAHRNSAGLEGGTPREGFCPNAGSRPLPPELAPTARRPPEVNCNGCAKSSVEKRFLQP